MAQICLSSMEHKICFKCNRELPLDCFYKHSRMKDGHLNKCKDCAKKDVHLKYSENINNEEYVDKERLRGREKYKRLNYKNRIEYDKYGIKGVSKYFRIRGQYFKGSELHHWDYSKIHDVFVLSRRLHSRLHKKLKLDEKLMLFRFGDILLDTKEKHYNFILSFMKENNMNENIINLIG